MATYAGRYSENLQDRYGNGYRNALVAVETLAAAPVTLYADRDKTAYIPASGLEANEIKADSRGNLIFFADPGNYQIVVTPVGGSTLAAFPVSVPRDPLEPDLSEGALQIDANLGDVADPAEARGNLGLGDAATQDAADLPVSTAQQTALDLRVEKATFDANTVLKADADNTPIALSVAEQRLIGRITGQVIQALTATQVLNLLDTAGTWDTGWTLPTLSTDITVNTNYLHLGHRRLGGLVILTISCAVASPAVEKSLFQLPVGFRPGPSDNAIGTLFANSGVSGTRIKVRRDGVVTTFDSAANAIGTFVFVAGH